MIILSIFQIVGIFLHFENVSLLKNKTKLSQFKFIPHLLDCRNIPTFLRLQPIYVTPILTHVVQIVGISIYFQRWHFSRNERSHQIVGIFIHSRFYYQYSTIHSAHAFQIAGHITTFSEMAYFE